MSAAAKSGSKPLTDVQKAKLQVIAKAIEEGDIRKAMLHANAKDVTNLPQCKALKAWAWQRNGDSKEAMDIAMDLIKTQPTDFAIMSPLLTVLQRANEFGMAVQMLEHAASSSGELSEDVGRQLCFLYIRQEDHKKLSQVSCEHRRGVRKAQAQLCVKIVSFSPSFADRYPPLQDEWQAYLCLLGWLGPALPVQLIFCY
jgi:hypothetical protein